DKSPCKGRRRAVDSLSAPADSCRRTATHLPIERRMNHLTTRRHLLAGAGLLLGLAAARAEAPGPLPRFPQTAAAAPRPHGVRLNTAIYAPRERSGPLPFILLRTPYGIEKAAARSLRDYLKELADDGYIFVFQDIRGRHGSEGQFVMLRPPRDRNDPKAID